MKKKFTLTILVVTCIVQTFLTPGCVGLDINIRPSIWITFYQNNYWEALIEIKAPLSIVTNSTAIENRFNQIIQTANKYGVDESHEQYREGDDVVYVIKLSGENYQALSEMAFQGQADIERQDENGRQKIGFHMSSWNLGEINAQLSLTVTSGQILAASGQPQSSMEGSESITWQIRPNEISVSAILLPISCQTQSPTNVRITLLPDEHWYTSLELTGASQECTNEQLRLDYQGIETFANEVGATPIWENNLPQESNKLILTLQGAGYEALNSVVFDNQVNINLVQLSGLPDSTQISFNSYPRIGFPLRKISIGSSRIIQGNGIQKSDHEMEWDTDLGTLFVETETSTYTYFADAKLIIDFMTGEHWYAVLDVFVPPSYEKYSPTIESELLQFLDYLPDGVNARLTSPFGGESGNYLINYEGVGLANLEQALFQGSAKISADETGWFRQIDFTQVSEPDWQFRSLSLVLRGGDILVSNGDLVENAFKEHEKNNVSWKMNQIVLWNSIRPGETARLTERFDFSLFAIVDTLKFWISKIIPVWIQITVWALLVLLIVYLAILWRKIKNSRKAISCSTCGFEVPADAEFCPNCGQKRYPLLVEFLFVNRVSKKSGPEINHKKSETGKLPKTSISALFIEDDPANLAQEPIDGNKTHLLNASLVFSGSVVEMPREGKMYIGDSIDCHVRIDAGMKFRILIARARASYYLQVLSGNMAILVDQKPVENAVALKNNTVIQIGTDQVVFKYPFGMNNKPGDRIGN